MCHLECGNTQYHSPAIETITCVFFLISAVFFSFFVALFLTDDVQNGNMR